MIVFIGKSHPNTSSQEVPNRPIEGAFHSVYIRIFKQRRERKMESDRQNIEFSRRPIRLESGYKIWSFSINNRLMDGVSK